MVSILSLWLPILGSAVLVFIASSIVHMVLPYHRSDFRKVPSEDDVMEALRRFSIPPGDYAIPCAGSPKDMGSPAFIEKATKGPVALVTVIPSGPPAMGASLVQWFVFSLVVGVLAAYVSGRTLSPGANYLDVFRVAGTTAFIAYGIVKLTLRPAQCWDEHSPAPLPSASLSARNHQPCRLALPQILHELPGC